MGLSLPCTLEIPTSMPVPFTFEEALTADVVSPRMGGADGNGSMSGGDADAASDESLLPADDGKDGSEEAEVGMAG